MFIHYYMLKNIFSFDVFCHGTFKSLCMFNTLRCKKNYNTLKSFLYNNITNYHLVIEIADEIITEQKQLKYKYKKIYIGTILFSLNIFLSFGRFLFKILTVSFGISTAPNLVPSRSVYTGSMHFCNRDKTKFIFEITYEKLCIKFSIIYFTHLNTDGTRLCNDLNAPPAKLANVDGLMFEFSKMLNELVVRDVLNDGDDKLSGFLVQDLIVPLRVELCKFCY
ncbi:hypothetical protein AGLY_005520 [Aphis glycines]|uniref:Uncharacterized protein n=1 Tax=Aphis glycines TaxID=307491 RepID=A0A6G0TU86_APHGL|nr:hypothetical protein AGLY_005520 [Aphis glycines]